MRSKCFGRGYSPFPRHHSKSWNNQQIKPSESGDTDTVSNEYIKKFQLANKTILTRCGTFSRKDWSYATKLQQGYRTECRRNVSFPPGLPTSTLAKHSLRLYTSSVVFKGCRTSPHSYICKKLWRRKPQASSTQSYYRASMQSKTANRKFETTSVWIEGNY